MKNLYPSLLTVAAFVLFCSHDMFLKLGDYHLPPNAYATIELVNGTFDASENTIDRDRMLDVSVVSGGNRQRIDTTKWTEQDLSTLLQIRTGDPGTYVAGVSTRARNIEMDAEAFNGYLEHDGVLDELAYREANGTRNDAAVERYSKHVKTIFQVGSDRTDDYAAKLGYPIEFIPLTNPYTLHVGENLDVRLLLEGQPLPNHPVLIGTDGGHDHGHSHDHDHAGDHDHDDQHTHGGETVRTDSDGIVRVSVANTGTWHLRTIHMAHPDEPGLTHESNWATLTFGVSSDAGDHGHAHNEHGHDHGTADAHDHEHHHEGGLPGWAWWAISLAIVAGLFVYFKRNS